MTTAFDRLYAAQQQKRADCMTARGLRTDMHAHYCGACAGYTPCAGLLPPSRYGCLLPEACPQCSAVPEGFEPVAVEL